MRSTFAALTASLALVASLSLAAPAFAQARPDDTQRLTTFSHEALKPVVSPVGGAFSQQQGSQSAYSVFEKDGLKVVFDYQACDGDTQNGCVGALMTAYVSYPKTTSKAAALEAVNAFNLKYSIVKVVVLDDGVIGITRYMIADYGISYGAIRTELDTLDFIARDFMTKVLPTLR
jgi:hypothetical protein